MTTSPNSQAIQTVNGLISGAQSLMNIYNSQVIIDAQWSDNGVATYIAAMTTAPLNVDGSQSANADISANTSHPILGSAYPQLSRPLTSIQITQLKTILDAIVTLVNGSAVTAQTGARGILNFAVGG
jgi:hypothetical protein